MGCRNRTEARQSGVGEGKSQKPEEGSELEDILKQTLANSTRIGSIGIWMDRLYGRRAPIEAALCGKEITLLSLKKSILLYDLTST